MRYSLAGWLWPPGASISMNPTNNYHDDYFRYKFKFSPSVHVAAIEVLTEETSLTNTIVALILIVVFVNNYIMNNYY